MNSLRNLVGWFIIPSFLLFSCGKEASVKEKQVGDFSFKIRKTPANDVNNTGFTQLLLELSTRDKKQDLVKFLASRSGVAEEQVLYYLSYGMQNDIYIVGKAGKNNPELYHFERSYDLKPFRTFNIGFMNNDSEEFDLVIDSEIFDVGIVKIKFDKI